MVTRASAASTSGAAGSTQVGGLMMLVEHDLDALFLGDLPLVDEAVVERRALLRVVVPVRQIDPDQFVSLRRRQVGIGVLAEMPGLHTLCLLRKPDQASRKPKTFAAKVSGCSTWSAWPASAIVSTRACGTSRA